MKTCLLIIASLFTTHFIFSQTNTPCASGSPNATVISVNSSCTYIGGSTTGATQQTNAANGGTPSCGSMGPDVWYRFVAPASGSVTITTQAGSITDGVMALYSGTCGAFTELACNDDAIGLMPEISYSSLTPGNTYFIRFWEYGGGTGTFDICVAAAAAPAGNTTCTTQTPICSGTPINFTANTGGTPASTVNPGNNYGCLFTSPNPSWYYLQIATPGSLVVNINAASDVDFALWGPYANLATATGACNTYPSPLDCSYSIAAVEQVNVASVLMNQVYVLLVTNYANTVQNITVSNAGGTATTNCAIVLPAGITEWTGEDSDNGVDLKWATASEQNSQYFAVQRMTEELYWETIDVTPGAGNSSTTNDYRYTDSSAVLGVNYYRLMQVDLNGNTQFTSPLSVSHQGPTTFEVYPNPSQGNFVISVASESVSEIHLFDLSGKDIPVGISKTSSSIGVDASTVQNGIYTLEIVQSGMKKTQRIVVSHQ